MTSEGGEQDDVGKGQARGAVQGGGCQVIKQLRGRLRDEGAAGGQSEISEQHHVGGALAQEAEGHGDGKETGVQVGRLGIEGRRRGKVHARVEVEGGL